MIIAELCRATATGDRMSIQMSFDEVLAKQNKCQATYLKCVVSKRTDSQIFNQMYWNDSEALGQCVLKHLANAS
jgi:hypothetical protein